MTALAALCVAWSLFFVALGARTLLKYVTLPAGLKRASEGVLFGSIIGAVLLFAAAPIFLHLS